MAGTGTVLVDDPRLTARDEDDVDLPPERQPLRVVMGRRPVPAGRKVLDDAAATVVLATRDPHEALAELLARDRRHVLLEGGPTLAAAFLARRAGRRGGGLRRPDAARRRTARGGRPRHRNDRRRVAPRRAGRGDGRHRPGDEPPAHPHPTTAQHSGGTDVFTGIIEELGVVDTLEDQGDAVRLTVRGPHVTVDAQLGDSISVNGCCLTVAQRDGETFTADVMRETLDKTSLGVLGPGDRVNLERAVTADHPAGRAHRAGARRRHGCAAGPDAVRALGAGRDLAARGAVALPRRQGLGHRGRHLADGGLDRLDRPRARPRAASRSR